MRLSDLSQEQAQTLADLYLTNLLNQGIEQMDEVQMAIHNGLSFYASNLHSIFIGKID